MTAFKKLKSSLAAVGEAASEIVSDTASDAVNAAKGAANKVADSADRYAPKTDEEVAVISEAVAFVDGGYKATSELSSAVVAYKESEK